MPSRCGCRAKIFVSNRLSTVCHMGVLSMAIGKYICAHYLQALNTFLDISNYISTLFTDSKYGVNRRSGMDLERLGSWMLEAAALHLYWLLLVYSGFYLVEPGQWYRVKYRVSAGIVCRCCCCCTTGAGIIGLLYIALVRPGIDSCAGEWALGRGLVVCPAPGSQLHKLPKTIDTNRQPRSPHQ